MKRITLPPTLAAYAAGRDIAPLWVSPSGRAFYPIAGGAEDLSTDPPAAPPTDPPADPPSEPEFPANTPVDRMTADQQAAYYRHQARKHEDRNKELLRLTGGKYGDDLKAVFDELENLRDEKRTDGEKAVEEARRTAREEVTREYGPKSVRTAFELLLGDMPEEDRNAEIELLDLSKFLTDSGDVDTAKVRSHAEKIAPADKGQGNQRHDFGAGRRGAGPAKTGLSAGAELYAARKKSSTTVNS